MLDGFAHGHELRSQDVFQIINAAVNIVARNPSVSFEKKSDGLPKELEFVLPLQMASLILTISDLSSPN